jgi:outer membrane protein TolC
LLPLAHHRVEAQLAAYRSGQQGLAGVLDARRAEVDARLSILDLERDAARLWAQLRYIYLDTIAAAHVVHGVQP